MEISKSRWKETGVIGAETLRTRTEVPGDYRLGINTIGRMAKEGVITASVTAETDPRSNLDVGNAFISGACNLDGVGAVTANNYLAEPSSVRHTSHSLTHSWLVVIVLILMTSLHFVLQLDLAVNDQSSTYSRWSRWC